MSEKRWHDVLRQRIASLQVANGRPRVAVVGIGHELRGDDAAGTALARLLAQRYSNSGLLVIEAGPAPENCYGLLRRHGPDLVLFVDAALMDAEPGSIRLLGWDLVKAGGGSQLNASTHTFPLPALADLLAAELGCPVLLLGVQPARTTMNGSLSGPVSEAVETAARELVELFSVSQGATAT